MAALHVGAGTLALATFWTAALAKKGGPLHRAAGKAYLLCMLGIAVTAVPLIALLFADGHRAWATFLAFILLFVATHCWMAWAAIRRRHDWAAYAGRAYRGLAWANLFAGLGILLLGLATGRVLLVAFSGAGLFAGWFNLRMAGTPPTDPSWWLREHLRANLNNATATHISFLTIGMRKLFPAWESSWLLYVSWLAPLALSIGLRIWLEFYYRPAHHLAVPQPPA